MTEPLRIIFMGTPDFAASALDALQHAGRTIIAAYAQPPKPAGRGQQLRKTPVHLLADSYGIQVFTPKSLKSAEEQDRLRALTPDLIIVAAYGLLLPQAVLDIPRLGCVNIHASLLPRWRGAAPIQRALLAGDVETGITLMQMDAGLDTGAMLMKRSVPINDKTTASSLHDALALMGAEMIVAALDPLASGAIKAIAQSDEGMCYAAKLTRADGQINWQKDAEVTERQIRALTPWPGTFFQAGDEAIKVIAAKRIPSALNALPGTLLSDDFAVATGAGALKLLTIQRAGKKAADAPSVLRGMRLNKGFVFS